MNNYANDLVKQGRKNLRKNYKYFSCAIEIRLLLAWWPQLVCVPKGFSPGQQP